MVYAPPLPTTLMTCWPEEFGDEERILEELGAMGVQLSASATAVMPSCRTHRMFVASEFVTSMAGHPWRRVIVSATVVVNVLLTDLVALSVATVTSRFLERVDGRWLARGQRPL